MVGQSKDIKVFFRVIVGRKRSSCPVWLGVNPKTSISWPCIGLQCCLMCNHFSLSFCNHWNLEERKHRLLWSRLRGLWRLAICTLLGWKVFDFWGGIVMLLTSSLFMGVKILSQVHLFFRHYSSKKSHITAAMGHFDIKISIPTLGV